MFSSSRWLVGGMCRRSGAVGIRANNNNSKSILQQHRQGHTVRVILKEPIKDGKHEAREVLTVKPGYARNYLIPQKLALYAIPENFERMNLKDPALETPEEKAERLALEAADKGNIELNAARVLEKYLENKMLIIWRKVEEGTDNCHPGLVAAHNVRIKLGKQLKIDLEVEHETVHLHPEHIGMEKPSPEEIQTIMDKIDTSNGPCTVQIKKLGTYLAKISLAGGYTVPLRFEVAER